MNKKQPPRSIEIASDAVAEAGKKGSEFNPVKASIGERLLHHRQSMKLTQEALSILTRKLDSDARGVSRPVIVGYEKGDTAPGAREISLLANALEITPSYLVWGRFDLPRNSSEAGQILIDALTRFNRLQRSDPADAAQELIEGPTTADQIDSMKRKSLIDEARAEAIKETQKRNLKKV